MLFLSELESGRAVVALGSIRALPVIDQVVAEAADRAAAAGVELRVECTASFDLPLRARMLQVVVENLVENAIRYAGPGATCTVVVQRGRRRAASASSRTTAPGCRRRTCRASSSASTAPTTPARRRGTGLGLAIVKHVVAAAGGTVEATATPGGGLTVTCSFPAGL